MEPEASEAGSDGDSTVRPADMYSLTGIDLEREIDSLPSWSDSPNI